MPQWRANGLERKKTREVGEPVAGVGVPGESGFGRLSLENSLGGGIGPSGTVRSKEAESLSGAVHPAFAKGDEEDLRGTPRISIVRFGGIESNL